jgi:hypothetical protein
MDPHETYLQASAVGPWIEALAGATVRPGANGLFWPRSNRQSWVTAGSWLWAHRLRLGSLVSETWDVGLCLAFVLRRRLGPEVDRRLESFGICEKRFVDVNETRQGTFLRGRHLGSPVLLYLHGGLPEYFLQERRPTGLEDSFTVAWWEQRGAGLSYAPALGSTARTVIRTSERPVGVIPAASRVGE